MAAMNVSWPAWLDGQWTVVERSTREVNREIIQGVLLNSRCVDCHTRDHIVLQFDHRDPALKAFNISQAQHVHPRALLDEIAKCDIRCANCHVRRTAVQFNWWRLDVGALAPQLVWHNKKLVLRTYFPWAPYGFRWPKGHVNNSPRHPSRSPANVGADVSD